MVTLNANLTNKMPLIEHNIYPDRAESGIWFLSEDIDHFLSNIDLDPDEEIELNSILLDSKKLQWLGARYLLHKMSGRVKRGAINKTEKGFPRLENSSFSISLSHSENYVAAAAAPYPIGVDIQTKTPKIMRILDKFASDGENVICKASEDDLTLAHLIWSAKEGMFKAYGKGQVDFRRHLSITDLDKIEPHETSGIFHGELKKPDEEKMAFEFFYKNQEDHVFVLARNVS